MNASRRAILRLTGWYVCILMVLSVGFSTVIYQIANQNIRRGLPPRVRFTQDFEDRFGRTPNDQWAELIEESYRDAMTRLRWSLLVLNLVVLAGGAYVSYLLARRTLRPVEQALEDQRRFASDASHELRTPLAAMKTEIEVALRARDTPSHTAVLRSNLEEINRLEKLSSDLLRLARHDDQPTKPPLVPTSITAITKAAIDRVMDSAKKKEMTIRVEGEAGTILAEPSGLTESLVTILDNAIKYSPARSVVVITSTRDVASVMIAVRDQGVGIPPEDLPHIFERFYRADPSRTKLHTDGHGLGLAIAKAMVERMGGTIRATSDFGHGADVTITLPVSRTSVTPHSS